MEWRQQTSVSCADAFNEARRWIEEVTGKSFGGNDFRAALDNGVLLCDLINQLKPGIIKRVNRLSTPIAGLDNVNVFLKACGKLGLNDSQLFHPGDLQDLSTRVTLRRDESRRRLKNVLITIYWLGRKAQMDTFYSGPQLNFKAFEGLLGLALSKALEEATNVFVKEGGYRESRYTDGDECQGMRPCYRRGTSVDINFLDTYTARHSDGGCGSDAEAEQVYKMENVQPSIHQTKGYVPPPLRRKQGWVEKAGNSTSQLPSTYKIQVRPETPVQVNPGWIWSKSLNDIPMVYPVRKVSDGIIYDKYQDTDRAREWNQESKRRCSVAAKDSEAQWQEDLTKWKNRRRSTKSELHRKSQDREHVINKMTNGALSSETTAQGSPIKRDQSPKTYDPASHPFSTSPSKPSSYDSRSHTRAPLIHSYATEVPLSLTTPTRGSAVEGMFAPDGGILQKETYFAMLASDEAGVTTPSPDNLFQSQTQRKALTSQTAFPSTTSEQLPSLVTATQPNDTVMSTSSWNPTYTSSYNKGPFCFDSKDKTPDLISPAEYIAMEDLSHQSNKSQVSSGLEPAADGKTQQVAGISKFSSRTGPWSSSASLPRGYRRSEGSSRLSSAITARPFGVKQSRVTSLPRLLNVDDNQGLLLNSEKENTPFSSNKPSLKRQTAAAHLRGQYQASIRQKKANQPRLKGAEQRKEAKNNSFSSQTPCQATGYPDQPPSTQSQILPQPYTSPRSYKKRSLSFSSTANTDISKVDHSDMRVSLTLKPNSVPDFGFHAHWDHTGARIKFIQPGSPAELCRLCVDDEIVAVNGVAVTNINYNQWKDKMASCMQTGTLTMDIRRHGIKDWSTSEASHHSQPGQSRMTLNLTSTAPVLIGRPDYHANSADTTETAETQVSKLNGQTHNMIKVKAMDGDVYEDHNTARNKDITIKNQKRRAEFFKQRGGSESAISDLQVPSIGPSSSSWSWDHEEDRRRQEKWQEDQERLLQEQYKRDQERLLAEWQRAQQEAMSGNTFEITGGRGGVSTCQYVNGLSKKSGEEKQNCDGEDKTGAEGHHVQNDKILKKDGAEGCYGFAQLSLAHREKSLSTPVLTASQKQTGGNSSKRKGQCMSKAEKERQQILEEMKKRTQLLTDSSWIRQRRSSFHKEPIYVGVSMKRYESLDNLDSMRHSSDMVRTSSYPRPNSVAGLYCTPSRNASSRYSTGSLSSQKNAYTDSSHFGRMVSGTRTCGVCECVLGSGAAMIIEALSLYFHLNCFKCVGCGRRLRGTETRVRVRIRNRKPYCDCCYFHLKSTDALFM